MIFLLAIAIDVSMGTLSSVLFFDHAFRIIPVLTDI